MRKQRLFLGLSLLAILLAACAPVQTQARPPEIASATLIITGPTARPGVDLTATSAPSNTLNSANPASTVQAVATSRGPNLEATDPKTVSMTSGGLQLVEFFEFW